MRPRRDRHLFAGSGDCRWMHRAPQLPSAHPGRHGDGRRIRARRVLHFARRVGTAIGANRPGARGSLRPVQNFLFTYANEPDFIKFNWRVSWAALGAILVTIAARPLPGDAGAGARRLVDRRLDRSRGVVPDDAPSALPWRYLPRSSSCNFRGDGLRRSESPTPSSSRRRWAAEKRGGTIITALILVATSARPPQSFAQHGGNPRRPHHGRSNQLRPRLRRHRRVHARQAATVTSFPAIRTTIRGAVHVSSRPRATGRHDRSGFRRNRPREGRANSHPAMECRAQNHHRG